MMTDASVGNVVYALHLAAAIGSVLNWHNRACYSANTIQNSVDAENGAVDSTVAVAVVAMEQKIRVIATETRRGSNVETENALKLVSAAATLGSTQWEKSSSAAAAVAVVVVTVTSFGSGHNTTRLHHHLRSSQQHHWSWSWLHSHLLSAHNNRSTPCVPNTSKCTTTISGCCQGRHRHWQGRRTLNLLQIEKYY